MTSHPAGESRRKPRLAGEVDTITEIAEVLNPNVAGCEVQAKILIQKALLNCSERLVEVQIFFIILIEKRKEK